MKKLILYFDSPSIYRKEIYCRLDREYDCEWYFDDASSNVVSFSETLLSKVKLLHVLPFGSLYWTKGLLGLLKNETDNYVLIGATRNISLFVFLIIKKIFSQKKNIILWTHGYYGKENRFEILFWKRPLYLMADKILLYNEYARKLMIEDGIDEKKLFTIHNSLAYDNQLEIRNSLSQSDIYEIKFRNSYPVIIFIGRLNENKKLNLLFSAIAVLKGENKIHNIVLVGTGPEEKKLQTLANELNISDQVWFYGECFDERANAELIYNADLCVSPGNVGLTAIHSLMFGCPVITHNDKSRQMPEFEAINKGVTGDFFEKDNSESLAECIKLWLHSNNNRDEIRKKCFDEIDKNWNPNYQMSVFTKVIK